MYKANLDLFVQFVYINITILQAFSVHAYILLLKLYLKIPHTYYFF